MMELMMQMKFTEYLKEMGDSLGLENGLYIKTKDLKKFKKRFKDDFDGFIKHVKTRYKLSDGDIKTLKVGYDDEI